MYTSLNHSLLAIEYIIIANIPNKILKKHSILNFKIYLHIVFHFNTATIKEHIVKYHVNINSWAKLSHKYTIRTIFIPVTVLVFTNRTKHL